eukprot:1161974-Pelagomonas_calceolata.AAC.2
MEWNAAPGSPVPASLPHSTLHLGNHMPPCQAKSLDLWAWNEMLHLDLLEPGDTVCHSLFLRPPSFSIKIWTNDNLLLTENHVNHSWVAYNCMQALHCLLSGPEMQHLDLLERGDAFCLCPFSSFFILLSYCHPKSNEYKSDCLQLLMQALHRLLSGPGMQHLDLLEPGDRLPQPPFDKPSNAQLEGKDGVQVSQGIKRIIRGKGDCIIWNCIYPPPRASPAPPGWKAKMACR